MVDGSTSSRQGLRILLESGSRMIFRLSSTGTRGADQLAGIRQHTGMSTPTVIT